MTSIRVYCLGLAIYLSNAAQLSYAGLTGPPPSYLVRTADGEHVFVMLSDVPIGDDRGNLCEIPEQGSVSLRDSYPASGLYPLNSTAPLWTVNWYNLEHYTRLSPDGRFLIRINKYGGGHYAEKPSAYRAISFYNNGRLVKEYQSDQLVDWLEMMAFTRSNYHYLWVADFDEEVDNGNFRLITTTSDYYEFDPTTGHIVEQSHLWRHVRSAWRRILPAIYLLGILLFSTAAWRFFTGTAADDEPPMPKLPDARQLFRSGLRFSLRNMFLAITLVAVMFAKPHWLILSVGLTCAMWCTLRLSRDSFRLPNRRTAWEANMRRLGRWIAFGAVWFTVYALSGGPVFWALRHFNVPNDVGRVLMLTVYRPVLFLLGRVPILWQYFEWWHGLPFW